MMGKAFIGSVMPTLNYKDGVFFFPPELDLFGPQYEIIYSKWDAIVKA